MKIYHIAGWYYLGCYIDHHLHLVAKLGQTIPA
ncbi:hypothetical protein SAMN05444169_7632 [Bradyrhizobium erythrophlei]|uniref:Uncharacterized protein n=1 Tax=Bradyrhizobium erythrophlei TaxID=1437360 RepID=A0A1M5TAL7_9BRAD|nr:hypothetical protein SAMN05444169_7632 [Bradyrhizobium erythrophlei]